MRKFTIFTVILTIVIVVIISEIFVNDYLPSIKDKFSDNNSDEMELTLPNSLNVQGYEANVLGADVDYSKINDLEYEEVTLSSSDFVIDDSIFSGSDDFDDSNYLIQETIDLSNPDSNPTRLIPINSSNTGLPTTSYTSNIIPLSSSPGNSSIVDFEDENFVSGTQSVLIREDQIKSAGFVGAYLEIEPHNGYLFKTIQIDDLYDVDVIKTSIRTKESLLSKVYVFKIGPLSSTNEV